jgi:hypothetical protein
MPSWRAQGHLRNLLLQHCSVYVIACNSRTRLFIEQFCGLRPEVCCTISAHVNFAEETFANKLLDLLPVYLGLLLVGGGIVSMQATCEISVNDRTDIQPLICCVLGYSFRFQKRVLVKTVANCLRIG